MQNTEDFFVGFNNLKIYFQSWFPEKPKAVIQISHGYCEYSGRYKNLIKELVENDFAVYINDHQGHGKSEGKRNYIKSFDDYVEDLFTITKMIKEKYPDLSIFLLGHSMGSLVAQRYGIKYQNEIKGLILSGTGTNVPLLPKFMQILARIMNKILPSFKAASGIKPEDISSDPASVEDYRTDPMINYKFGTAAIGVCFMDHYKKIKDKIGTIEIPILLQKGENDVMMFGEKEVFEDLQTKDKTLNYYKGSKHEVYTKTKEKRGKAFQDLIDWVNNHL